MVSTQNAQMYIDELKFEIIGFFKNDYNEIFEMVTDLNDDGTINTIVFSQFGAIHQNYNLPVKNCILKMFHDNKNFNQILDNPFEFDEFLKKFN